MNELERQRVWVAVHLDCFVPRKSKISYAESRISAEPMREATTRGVVLWRCRRWRITSFRGGGTAMRAWGGSVSLRMEAITTDTVCGNAQTRPEWAGRRGRRAGKRPQRLAKGLTLTEPRLSFAFSEGTPRPEGQALRQPRGGPIEAALNFCLLFLQEKRKMGRSQKGHKKTSRRHRYARLAGSV